MKGYGAQRMVEGEKYRLSFTVGGLLASQGRTLAELFCAQEPSEPSEQPESSESQELSPSSERPSPNAEVGESICQIRKQAVTENVLAIRTPSANARIVGEVLKRLSALTFEELAYLAGEEASYEDRAALMWVAMCRYYALVGEFASEVVLDHFLEGNLTLTYEDYDRYFALKATWHPELDAISGATYKKLRENLFRAMDEARIIDRGSGMIVPYLMGGTLEKMLAEAPTTLQYFPMRRSRDFLALGTDSEVR